MRALRTWLFATIVTLGLGTPAVLAAKAATVDVSGPEISMLVRSTIVALQQANVTGNYSVLHDLGDRQFQAGFSQAALTDMFRRFRDERISLGPAVLYDPQLDRPPALSPDGRMRLLGHFATTPKEVIFDLVFLHEDGIWRIDSLKVGMRVPVVAASRASPATGAATDLPPMPLPRPAARAPR